MWTPPIQTLSYKHKSGPKDAILLSLSMLVTTEGKVRTVMEYKQLLEKHGFVDFKQNNLRHVGE